MVAVAKNRKSVAQWRVVEDAFIGALTVENRVDAEAGVIRGVKIVGVQSRNIGRTIGCSADQFGDAANKPYSYDPEGLKAAVPLYEGKSVFSNHRPYTVDRSTGQRVIEQAERDNGQLVGWVQNCRFVDGPPEVAGIYGDFHVFKSNPLAPTLFESAERKPDAFALSHEAFSKQPTVQRGAIVLPGIAVVDAIALVSGAPGTTSSLFESFNEGTMTKTYKEFFAEQPAAHKGARLILEMMDGPMGAPIAAVEAPGGEVAGASADELTKQAFRAMVMAAFDDDSLDTKATMQRIKDIFAAKDKLEGKTSAPEADGGGDAKPPVDESKIVSAAQSAVFECLDFLAEAKVIAPGRPVIEAMLVLPADRRKPYAVELGRTIGAGVGGGAGPRSADPSASGKEVKGGEGGGGGAGVIESYADFEKAMAVYG